MSKRKGSVIVSWDFSNGVETGVLLVGEKKPMQPVQVIAAYQGKEAVDLMETLTAKNLKTANLDKEE